MFPMTGERDEQRVAHRITSPMGWGSCEPPELPHEAVSRKGGWNGRSSALQCGVAHVHSPTYYRERRWAADRKEESPPTALWRAPAREHAERHGNGTETIPAGGNAMMPKGRGHLSRMKRADPAGARLRAA